MVPHLYVKGVVVSRTPAWGHIPSWTLQVQGPVTEAPSQLSVRKTHMEAGWPLGAVCQIRGAHLVKPHSPQQHFVRVCWSIARKRDSFG